MDRKYVGVLISIVILVGGIFGASLYFNNLETTSDELQWGIQEGDQFTYSLVETSGEIGWTYAEPLNVSRIVVKIDNLPILDDVSPATFGDLIVRHIKTTCYFENGSEIDAYWPNHAFSHLLLPVGDWDFIDLLYPDDPSQFCTNPTYGRICLYSRNTSPTDNGFFFAYYEVGIDDFHWDKGWLQRSTGIPETVNYIYDHDWLVYAANLTLIES